MSNALHWSVSEKCEALVGEVFPNRLESALQVLQPDHLDGFLSDRDWCNEYDIVYTRNFPFMKKLPKRQIYYGDLSICRSTVQKNSGNTAKLRVVQRINTPQANNSKRLTTEFDLQIMNDEVSSLAPDTVWHSKNTVFDRDSESEIEQYSTLEQWGRATSEGVIETSADGDEFRVVNRKSPELPLTSNWGIIDAVQRLGWQEPRAEVRFDMLENLDLIKADQRLVFLESFDFSFGDAELLLHGYCHVGEGILPSYYWVTENGQLLITRFGLMAYVFKSGGNTQ